MSGYQIVGLALMLPLVIFFFVTALEDERFDDVVFIITSNVLAVSILFGSLIFFGVI